ncbi:UbiD family decarboxylase [Streptomyces sp. NPDC002896]|uniref:UbiD family decarboxylase n=1 Tax=Streptomyces sp. NPDC002896 TaxID=3154438 RepID=UPI003329B302
MSRNVPDKHAVDLSFRSALDRLRAAGRLESMPPGCSTEFEVSGLMKTKDGDKALVFPEVAGHDLPIVGNILASERNCEAAFGTDRAGIRRLVSRGLAENLEPEVVSDGPVRQVKVFDDIDLGSALPALTHAPGDAGRYITAGLVIARHPHTGVYNASYHRMQLIEGNRTAIQMDLGRHLRSAWEAARSNGDDLPIAVVIGPDLSLLYAAAVMGSQMPESKDELAAAGAMQGSSLKVLKGLTQDVLVPANSEIALEGRISATDAVHEGPFGEFVGYHSSAGLAPVVHFTALTRRREAIYHAINGAGRETVMLRKHALETSALGVLQSAVPIVKDVCMTAGGLHRFHLNVAVRKDSSAHDGLQRNAALAAFGALKDLVRVVVVDDDIDIHSEVDVEYAIATRVDAAKDLVTIPGARGHEYIRVSDVGVGTKWLIDATVPFAERDRFRRIAFRSC